MVVVSRCLVALSISLAWASLPIFCFFIKYLWTPWAIHGALKRHGFKVPPPIFMVGNLLDIANMVQQEMRTDMTSVDHNFKNRFFPHAVEWSRRYGEKFVMWIGHEPRIYLTNAELIRELLYSKHLNDCGRSHLLQKMFPVVFGKGLFNVNGKQWSHWHRIVVPTFKMEKNKTSVEIMSNCTKELVDEWGEMIASARGERCEIEVTKYMGKLATNIILRAEFGMNDGKLGNELYEYLTQLEELMS